MKNTLLTLCLIAGLSACSTTSVDTCEDKTEAPAPVQYTQPQYVHVQRQAPTGYAYTVSEPVEVVYRNTTYKTVYEPKTFTSTAYVKKPYTCNQGDICKNAYTAQPAVAPQSVPAPAPQPEYVQAQ